jgi:predicted secreted protein
MKSGRLIGLAGALLAGSSAHAAPEGIVVEAQRRAQNLQDVPIAVTTLDAVQLEKLQVFRVENPSVPAGVTNIRTVLPPRTYMVSVRFNF